MKNFWSKIIAGFATLAAVLTLSANVQAAELGGKPSVNLSENRAGMTSTYTVNFRTASAVPVNGKIDVVFPAGFDASHTTLGTYDANLGTINPAFVAGANTVELTIGADSTLGADTTTSFQIVGVINTSTSGDHNHVDVQTYQADGTTLIDEGTSFDFSIQPRGPNEANSTIATNPVATTTMVVGTSIQIDFTARDDSNNTLANQSVEWTVSDSSFGLSKTTGLTNASGVDSVTLTAPTTAGLSTTVTARSGDFSYNITLTTASIVTTHDVLNHWNISNITSPQIAGGEFTFTVTPVDQYDNVLTDYDWTNLANRPTFAGLNSMPGYAVTYTYDSANNGVATYRVTPYAEQSNANITATLATVTGTSNNFDVTHNTAISIAVTPDPSTITAGNTQTYTVTAIDTYGNTWDVTADSTFTIVEAGHNGSWNNNVYTSHTAGAWTVRATYNALTDDAVLNVVHNVTTTVTINPNTEQDIIAGDHIDFTATAYDAYGNLTGDAITWTGTSAADSGLFNSTTAGSYTVYATAGGIESTHVTVNVDHNVTTTVTINPNTEQDIIAGDHIDFTATAYDAYGNLTGDAITWTGTSAADSGLFNSTTAGSYTVYATAGGIESTHVTVNVTHNIAVGVSVDPASVTLTSDETQQFTATAVDLYGNTWDVTNLANWSTTDPSGTISVTGLYNPGTAGDWTVSAEYGGYTDFANVHVDHGTAVSITITPANSTITAGDTQSYTATATDADGNTWDVTSEAVFSIVEPGDNGSWASNVYTSHTAGIWTVQGDYNSLTDTASLTVNHASADHFTVVAPGTATAGTQFSITISVYDQFDNLVTDFSNAVVLSGLLNSPDNDTPIYGAINFVNGVATVDVTGYASGLQTITATSGGVTGTSAIIDFSPSLLDQIVISTGDPTTITAGQTVQFVAESYDQYGNTIFTTVYTWDNTNASGLFTNTTANTYTVQAHSGLIDSNPITVIVNPAALDHIAMTPSVDQSIIAGQTVQFTATGYDVYGNVRTSDVYDWNNAVNGLFDNTTVGTYAVYAYSGSIQSNHVTVSVAHSTAVAIVVTPDPSTITAGNTQTYAVTATDAYGNTWDVTADSTFTIVEAGHNGSWNNNVYTSHTAGAWTVRATYNALTDDAVLNVIHNTLDHIDVDPDSTQTITAGDTIQFVAQGYDAYDNLIGGLTFEWNNADSTGLFDETTSGTYDVYAYIDNIESNHVDVIVNPGLASNITIQPSTNTDVSADTHQVTITATVRDQYGNLVADGTQINWTSTNFTLGLVSSTTVNGVATVVLTTTTHAGDTGTVTGTVNGHSATTGTITVVHGALDHISISPSSSDIDQSGHTRSFTVAAYDQYGNAWDVTAYTSFTIDSDDAFGRLSDNTYTAGQIGTHHVYANYSGKTATATVNVLSHASVSSILITNKITNLYVGLTHNMQVRFRDAYGNSWDGTTLVTWTISPEGYATIDANGVITGILPGTFTVTATYGSHHDDDSIVVLAVAGVTQQTSGSNNAGADDNGQIKGTEITTLGEDNTTEEEPVSNRNWIIFLVGLGAVILAGTYMIFTYFMQDSNGQNGDNSEKTEEKEEKKPKVASNTKTSEQTRW